MFWQAERRGRDRADKPEYKVKLSVGLLLLQHGAAYRVLSQLLLAEHGGSRKRR